MNTRKLHNLSHFCADSDIKPEIACVLVKKNETAGTIETVATDSYRLATITYKLSEWPELTPLLSGLYEAKAFKELCSQLNKVLIKKDAKDEAVQFFMRAKTPLEAERYPEYHQLFRQIDNVKQYQEGIRGKFRCSYLVDHIKLCGALAGDDFNGMNINDMFIKLHGMLEFKTDNARVLLMPLNK